KVSDVTCPMAVVNDQCFLVNLRFAYCTSGILLREFCRQFLLGHAICDPEVSGPSPCPLLLTVSLVPRFIGSRFPLPIRGRPSPSASRVAGLAIGVQFAGFPNREICRWLRCSALRAKLMAID